MSDVITEAAEYARAAHESIAQRRKYTNAPYIVHSQAVAETVSSVTDAPATIAAAWLHYVVEDTPVTLKQVTAQLGVEIARQVSDLTNTSNAADGNRRQRKAIDRKHTAKADPRARRPSS